MGYPKRARGCKPDQVRPSDELGNLVRRTLYDLVADRVPSERVWHKIRARVVEPRGVPRRRAGLLRLLRPGLVVQATILGILLVAFGLGLGGGNSKFRMWLAKRPTPVVEETGDIPQFSLDDMLSGVRLARSLKELSIWDYRLAPYVDYRR